MKFHKIKKFEHFFSRISLDSPSLNTSSYLGEELLNNQDFPTADDVIDYMLEFADKEEIIIVEQKQDIQHKLYHDFRFLLHALYIKNSPIINKSKPEEMLHLGTKALVYLRLDIPHPPEIKFLSYSSTLEYVIDKLQICLEKFVLRSGHLVNISAIIDIENDILADTEHEVISKSIVRIEFLK